MPYISNVQAFVCNSLFVIDILKFHVSFQYRSCTENVDSKFLAVSTNFSAPNRILIGMLMATFPVNMLL